eukprot:TRINITY_DN1187_c0_g1_i2.p1 TRINITY_DN1187_c0_g1~~TRINITY_DN1187_c0_g1_i2.p1  ORF type:complete len:576 (+),score=134.92 TRINITY_DN1187_c0_g1_i2:65-1729(+)
MPAKTRVTRAWRSDEWDAGAGWRPPPPPPGSKPSHAQGGGRDRGDWDGAYEDDPAQGGGGYKARMSFAHHGDGADYGGPRPHSETSAEGRAPAQCGRKGCTEPVQGCQYCGSHCMQKGCAVHSQEEDSKVRYIYKKCAHVDCAVAVEEGCLYCSSHCRGTGCAVHARAEDSKGECAREGCGVAVEEGCLYCSSHSQGDSSVHAPCLVCGNPDVCRSRRCRSCCSGSGPSCGHCGRIGCTEPLSSEGEGGAPPDGSCRRCAGCCEEGCSSHRRKSTIHRLTTVVADYIDDMMFAPLPDETWHGCCIEYDFQGMKGLVPIADALGWAIGGRVSTTRAGWQQAFAQLQVVFQQSPPELRAQCAAHVNHIAARRGSAALRELSDALGIDVTGLEKPQVIAAILARGRVEAARLQCSACKNRLPKGAFDQAQWDRADEYNARCRPCAEAQAAVLREQQARMREALRRQREEAEALRREAARRCEEQRFAEMQEAARLKVEQLRKWFEEQQRQGSEAHLRAERERQAEEERRRYAAKQQRKQFKQQQQQQQQQQQAAGAG